MLFVTKDVTQMSEQNGQNGANPQETPQGITKITVGGYKSIAQEQSIEIRPLTILAGANSSGKSSIMQPLLLLKQTLEAPYDPGALKLNGPIIDFTSVDQLLSRRLSESSYWFVRLEMTKGVPIALYFEPGLNKGFTVKQIALGPKSEIPLDATMTHHKIVAALEMDDNDIQANIVSAINESALSIGSEQQIASIAKNFRTELSISRNRCFLELAFKTLNVTTQEVLSGFNSSFNKAAPLSILQMIHLQGVRGSPTRTSPVTATGEIYPGSFEIYTASVLLDWQMEDKTMKLRQLQTNLANLGLTNAVKAEMRNDAEVEIRVGRTLQSDASDLVSIADVGIGVSQTLPVLVALLAAKPGQLVYLEQPEIHLHPRAQTAMAQVLADAAMRGVRVVAETHSSLLLLGVQTLVAEGKLPPELVKLHWFTRGDDGATTIQSADLDEGGAFGDWPEDFDDVTLNAQSRYLDAAEQRLVSR